MKTYGFIPFGSMQDCKQQNCARKISPVGGGSVQKKLTNYIFGKVSWYNSAWYKDNAQEAIYNKID